MLSTLRAGMHNQGRRWGAFRPGVESLEVRAMLHASRLSIAVPATVRAGEEVAVTVTAMHDGSTVDTGYASRVHFTSTDPAAELPADYTFGPPDGGRHTFNMRFHTVGAVQLTVTDTSAAKLEATASLTLVPSPADHFAVSVVPAINVGGTVDVVVSALDGSGNLVTDYTGTVHLATTDSAAVVPADYTFTAADHGMHTFQVTLNTPGQQVISVTDTAVATRDGSSVVNVTTEAAHHFDVIVPAAAVAGQEVIVEIIARDAAGNTLEDYQGTVRLSSTDGLSKPPADQVFAPDDHGTITVPYRLYTAGTQTINVVSTSIGTDPNCGCDIVTRGSGDVVVSAGPAARLSVNAGPMAIVGAATDIVLVAEDVYGNVVTGYTGTVRLSSSDPSAALPSSYTFTDQNAGIAVLSAAFSTAGNQNITAADSRHSYLQGTATISVRYGTPNQNYVSNLYPVLLGRPSDPAGVAHWSARLDGGMTRNAVITAIRSSDEYHRLVVSGLYQSFLGRDADPQGLDYFAGQMVHGMSADQVTMALLSSQEYFEQRGAGLTAGFLSALYVDVLGRSLDHDGESYFGTLLERGVPRDEVVRQLLQSTEAVEVLVHGIYDAYLGRAIDEQALSYFVDQLRAGRDSEWLTNVVLSSNEYYSRTT